MFFKTHVSFTDIAIQEFRTTIIYQFIIYLKPRLVKIIGQIKCQLTNTQVSHKLQTVTD